MNGAVKVGLQVAFLVGLVYVLAAVFGFVEGVSYRAGNVRLAVGKGGKRCNGQQPGAVLAGAYPYANTGMVSTLIASAGTDVPRVGINSQLP